MKSSLGEWLKLLSCWFIIIASIAALAMWLILQWNLCRSAGLPFLYCVQHVL